LHGFAPALDAAESRSVVRLHAVTRFRAAALIVVAGDRQYVDDGSRDTGRFGAGIRGPSLRARSIGRRARSGHARRQNRRRDQEAPRSVEIQDAKLCREKNRRVAPKELDLRICK
jgi:hypothetical protein